jgi:hypothetical protein
MEGIESRTWNVFIRFESLRAKREREMISHAEELAKKDALGRQDFAARHLINGELDRALVVRGYHYVGNVYVLLRDGGDK